MVSFLLNLMFIILLKLFSVLTFAQTKQASVVWEALLSFTRNQLLTNQTNNNKQQAECLQSNQISVCSTISSLTNSR